MEYDDKIRWLHRYQDALRLQRMLEEEAEQLRAEAERVTPLLCELPGTGGADRDRLPRAVERIIDAEQELEAQVNCCQAIRREVVEAINTVEQTREYEILRRRYILCERWEQIADEMNLALRWVYRKHKCAVCELAI